MDFLFRNGATVGWVLMTCCALALAGPQQPRGTPSRKVAKGNSHGFASGQLQQEIDKAKKLLEAGSRDQAIALLRELVSKAPDDADAHLLLGTALALIPEPSQALQELRRAVELRPTFAPAYYTLGTALARFTDLDGAKQTFEKAIELEPRFTEAHVSLALVQAQRKEFASARQHLGRAIELQGNSPEAAYSHYLMAQVLAEENQLEKALQELEVAIRLRPRYAEAFLSQGLIRKRLRDNTQAFHSFKKAVELSPRSPAARYELGTAYLLGGHASQAIEHLQTAWELKPDDRSALSQLCQAFHRAGRSEEAKTCQQELASVIQTKLTAEDLSAAQLNNEGVELEKAGNLVAALEKYRAAVKLNPFQTVFRRNLALALCRLGRWDEGLAELKEVLKADPEDAEATRAYYIALENIRKPAGSSGDKAPPEQRRDRP